MASDFFAALSSCTTYVHMLFMHAHMKSILGHAGLSIHAEGMSVMYEVDVFCTQTLCSRSVHMQIRVCFHVSV